MPSLLFHEVPANAAEIKPASMDGFKFGLFENKTGFAVIHRLVSPGEDGLTAKTRLSLKDDH